jgi:hypothetical protein
LDIRSKEGAVDHRPVPISRRDVLRIAVFSPLIAIPATAVDTKPAVAADNNPVVTQRRGHAHRTIIGVI